MLFSSSYFIFAFLPVCVIIYFLLNKLEYFSSSKAWLCLASLFFYGYWEIKYIPLLLSSITFNYVVGSIVTPKKHLQNTNSKYILTFGIIVNIGILAYYKYANFFLENIGFLLNDHFSPLHLLLPLGISFFTFTQIAFLVDSYKGKVEEYNFINYFLFVTFFPHLIAGPILHHGEMMPQFKDSTNNKVNFSNIISGLCIFAIGLIKKVIIADTFATFAQEGYSAGYVHDFYSAWATSLSYTFQLYFDFSGYCDMAIGAALLFNIMLPINFNSPYKAVDIQDFWRRWHITLGRYLRDYIYIPLGGNRLSYFRTYFNLFITFSIAGLWHGASWLFIIWGAMHGIALIIHRAWKSAGMRMYLPIAWFITFIFVNISWVIFRSNSFGQALNILSNMFTLSSMRNISLEQLPLTDLSRYGQTTGWIAENISYGIAAYSSVFMMSVVAMMICLLKNSQEIIIGNKIGYLKITTLSIFSSVAIYLGLHSESAVFLYFNF
ncbi:MBOAT family O-acyltransferase [Enterobacter cancerogenus]|uniref:MBOAT family O-acyltransferase n=1 Tax=Enterobacter cancerogenus TaxID=69218 RepID=UPI000537CB71|nr:MBOAT family protein [Enterobacter cancerogenus]KGT90752.1 acetyltransferase [Enterobacter cancerogenus]